MGNLDKWLMSWGCIENVFRARYLKLLDQFHAVLTAPVLANMLKTLGPLNTSHSDMECYMWHALFCEATYAFSQVHCVVLIVYSVMCPQLYDHAVASNRSGHLIRKPMQPLMAF